VQCILADCRVFLPEVFDSLLGWPIADTTAHALEAVLLSHKSGIIPKDKQISDERLFDAVNILLSYQNKGGGWATYENTRYSKLVFLTLLFK
jgi:squalene cyclase